MAQQVSGMAAWMSSIRTSLAKDPCRKLFEDQVQKHGFIFLEDYLENILDGPKQEPIIDLVKTPARKKAAPKRTRAATAAAAKARNAITLSNIDEVEPPEDVFCVTDEPEDVQDRAGPENPICAQNIHTGNHTQPLPIPSQPNSPVVSNRDVFTAPLPILPASPPAPVSSTTTTVPLYDSPSHTLARNSSVPQFPTLPAPSPLRKSTRVTSMGAETIPVVAATTAPAQPPVLGKRTSWLMKAREVKAMEDVGPSRISALNSGPGAMTASSSSIVPVKRKSGEMLSNLPLTTEKSDEGRRPKVAKASESDSAPEKSTRAPSIAPGLTRVPEEYLEPLNDNEDEASFMGIFKRTVEGLGARAGKSIGKSLGGSAATAALAEARAAAEARVAERNKIPGEDNAEPEDSSGGRADEPQATAEHVRHSKELECKPSISDIVHTNDIPAVIRPSSTVPHSVADESISTTPPNSPPPTRISASSRIPSPGPVFNKQPPPVFVPPTSKKPAALTREFSFNLPQTTFTLPPPMSLGLPAKLTSPPSSLRPPSQICSSKQSSQASTFSDAVFDREDDVPAWMSSTQDTEYTDIDLDSDAPQAKLAALDDDDDSWPLEEKLASSEQAWAPFNFNNKEDSMTWSTLPTESQGPTRTRPDLTGNAATKTLPKDEESAVPTTFAMDIDNEAGQVLDDEIGGPEEEAGHDSIMHTSDLGDILKVGQSTVDLVESGGIPRSQSKFSTSSSLQQSQQVGFFSHATKIVSSVLGAGKKVKSEVKSLQLAAAAAKKQEEEANKKASRLKEMESRRQAALARKAEEDKARAVDEEKKLKEESDKRKRERDETNEKRPLKTPAPKKTEEDVTKKRKITIDEKKIEVKKPPSKDKKDALLISKLAKSSLATPATKVAPASKPIKVPSSALASSATYNASHNVAGSSTVKLTTMEAKSSKIGPPKGKAKLQENEDKLPSAVVQDQMAARAMAQIRAAKPSPEVPSESIELPDINSEYSDSEDEDRVRTFDPPNWAQSPELRQALQMQSTVDPDDIFGAIRPLRMEEVFRTRQSRFRARTSSANWSGTDRLTVEEEREYARRMGFTKHAS